MTVFKEILEHSTEITQLIEDWGCTNPRLFKSVVENERGHLNILVDPVDVDVSFFRIAALESSLEALLKCNVVLATKDMLADNYRKKIIKEAIPLSEKSTLSEYYGESFQFDLPDEKKHSESDAIAREHVRNQLVQKRKRKEDANSVNSQTKVVSLAKDEFFYSEIPTKRKKDTQVYVGQKESLNVDASSEETPLKHIPGYNIRTT